MWVLNNLKKRRKKETTFRENTYLCHMIMKVFYSNTFRRDTKMRFFVTIFMVVLLCLSLDSCKKAQTQDAEGDTIEVANSEDDGKEAGEDSLTDATTDSKIKAERMKKKDVILRKTKVQFVIY